MKTLHSLKPINIYPSLTQEQKWGIANFIGQYGSQHPVTVTRESPPRIYYDMNHSGNMRNFSNAASWANPETSGRQVPREFNWNMVNIVERIGS
jgi:hypothetical protein